MTFISYQADSNASISDQIYGQNGLIEHCCKKGIYLGSEGNLKPSYEFSFDKKAYKKHVQERDLLNLEIVEKCLDLIKNNFETSISNTDGIYYSNQDVQDKTLANRNLKSWLEILWDAQNKADTTDNTETARPTRTILTTLNKLTRHLTKQPSRTEKADKAARTILPEGEIIAAAILAGHRANFDSEIESWKKGNRGDSLEYSNDDVHCTFLLQMRNPKA